MQNLFNQIEFLGGLKETENLEPRVHVATVLDFSGSMADFAPQLPDAVNAMAAELARHTTSRLRVEMAACPFDREISFYDFAPVTAYLESPVTFEGGGLTRLGGALLTTIRRIRERRDELTKDGIHCMKAVSPVISDGCATDPENLARAQTEIRQAVAEGVIQFVPIAPDASSVQTMRAIFGVMPILLNKIDYGEIFRAFARSLSQYSQSALGWEPDAHQMITAEFQRMPSLLPPDETGDPSIWK